MQCQRKVLFCGPMASLKDNLKRVIPSTNVLALILLAVLILWGGYLRLHNLEVQSYWMDEGFTINAVLSIVERGDTTLDSGKRYSCPTYCYPTAAIAKVFGNDAFSYRILSALSGIAFIAVIFFIARSLFTLPVALLTSLFTAFSYIQIAWSRQARWYTLFELFFWLALFFFYKTLYEEEDRKRILFASLTAGTTILAILTHGLGYLLPLIFAGWFIFDKLFLQRQSFKELTLPVLSLVGAVGVASIFFLTEVGARFLPKIHFFWGVPYYGNFYLVTYWFLIALGIIAFLYIKKGHTRSILFVVFTLGVYLIPLMLMTDIVHYRYLFHLTPALFMLAALGVENLRTQFANKLWRVSLVAVVLILFFSVGTGILFPQSFYLLEADDPEAHPGRSYYAYTPQPDWNAAYEYIQSNREDGDIVISSMPQFNKIFLSEPGYWLKYNYYGADDRETDIEDDREYYVGAEVVDDLSELQALTENNDGYLVIDYMATDVRIPDETLEYIKDNFDEIWRKRTNYYSNIWVYRF